MAIFKNIRIPKRGGGTRTQRVKVLASGKYKFVKNIDKKKTSKSTKTKTKTKRKKSMAKKKRRRKREITIPIAIVAPIAGNLAWCYKSHNTWPGRLNLVCATYTGYDPGLAKWRPILLMQGMGSLLVGALVHKLASILGINRMLGQAKVPFLRI